MPDLTITLPDELHDRLMNEVSQGGESLDGFIWLALEEALDTCEADREATE